LLQREEECMAQVQDPSIKMQMTGEHHAYAQDRFDGRRGRGSDGDGAVMVLPRDGLKEPSPAGDGLAFPADQVPA
jgi:hypothetical protein